MSYFLLYGLFALWVLFDAVNRKMGASTVGWTVGTAVVGPIILPIYLASRPLKRGEIREGGKAWNILKNFAILWTIVMIIASIVALFAMAKGTTGLKSDVEMAGAGIGMVLGIGILAAGWFFPTVGAALLGFLLKKNTVVENGPTGSLVGQDSTSSAAGGWAGLSGVAVLGLIAVGIASNSTSDKPQASPTGSIGASVPLPASGTDGSDWGLSESTSRMDNSPVVILHKLGSNGSSLMIRCTEHRTVAYVDTHTIVDNGGVRLRFDQSVPTRQTWTRSTDDQALFAPDAIVFARKLAATKIFLLEYTPFQEGTRTLTFDVSGLEAKLARISDACDWEAVDKSRARAKAADAALRERISRYVHLCDPSGAFAGQWCWSDPNDALFNRDTPAGTKEEALEDAVRTAKMGLAFKANQ